MTVRLAAERLGVSVPTANTLVAQFEDLAILREVTGVSATSSFGTPSI